MLELEERRARTLIIIGMIATLTWVLSFGQRFSIYKKPYYFMDFARHNDLFFCGRITLVAQRTLPIEAR